MSSNDEVIEMPKVQGRANFFGKETFTYILWKKVFGNIDKT